MPRRISLVDNDYAQYTSTPLSAIPLTREAYAPYGHVIEGPPLVSNNNSISPGVSANQGTAQRFNFLANIVNHRSPLAFSCYPGSIPHPDSCSSPYKHPSLTPYLAFPPAVPNLCLFRCKPTPTLPFKIKLLERHRYSSQMFVPMSGNTSNTTSSSNKRGYLVIVCLNDPLTDLPDLKTLQAFIATSVQAINYHPGIWHHPMIALEHLTDFVCLVHERREMMGADREEDTEEVFFDDGVIPVVVEGYRGAEEMGRGRSSKL